MVRISGVVLPGNKKLFVSLTAIKGIGQSLARTICADVKIDPLTKTDDVTEQQEALLRTRIGKEVTEGELTRKVGHDVKRLQDIGTWRGMLHRKTLPVRGQTSRRNARTKRGKRKTGSSGRTTLRKT